MASAEEPTAGAPVGAEAPVAGRAARLLRAAGLMAVAGVPVTVLAVLVRSESSVVHRLDLVAIRGATAFTREHPDLYRFLLGWQEAFQARWVNLVAALVCLWVWRRHGLGTRALWAVVTILVTWNLGLGLKHLVGRARPVIDDALTRAPGYSFPSGHAMNTTATGVTLVILLWPLLGRRGRAVLASAVGSAVVVTGLDRVYLGAHYPSDVVAGIALGSAMAGASYLGWRHWHASPETQSTATSTPRSPS